MYPIYHDYMPMIHFTKHDEESESQNKLCAIFWREVTPFLNVPLVVSNYTYTFRFTQRPSVFTLIYDLIEGIAATIITRKPVGFMQSWNCTSRFKSHLLFIWNFQMRLETRYAIWNFWNLKLFKHVMGVAYLKLSDETWNEMRYLKLLKLKTFQTCHGSCLFETFRWDLKWDVLLETFQPFQTHHESCLFETFRWNLKQDILFEMFETWNFSNMSWELLIWNFQMRLEKEVLFETFETWNFSNPSWGGVAYLKLSNETWNEMCYLKLFNLFKPIMRAAYLKLSDETWNKFCYLKHLKLETFQTCHGSCLFKMFQMRLETRYAIWNIWNLKLETFQTCHGSCLFGTFR